MNILEIGEENIISDNILTLLGNEIKLNDIKLERKKHFIGIRPEHLKVDGELNFKFAPEIELVENLGNEKIVYIKKDKHLLSAKIPSETEIKNQLGFKLNDILIFNENGQRLKK